MAVRPASRGGDGTLYGLITFVILFVASLGAFIWQLTVNGELTKRIDGAEARARSMGTPPSYYSDEATNRSTSAADVMNDHLQKLATLITGKQDGVQPAIDFEVRQALKRAAEANPGTVEPTSTLLTAVGRLSDALTKNKQLLAQTKAERDESATEIQSLAGGNLVARKEFQDEVAKLKDDFGRVEQEKEDALSAKDKQLADAQAAHDAQTEEMNRSRVDQQARTRETDIVIGRINQLNANLQSKISELKGNAFDVNAILTKSDGRVMRAIPGSDVVYLNLGAKDKLRAGMGFEVFSPLGERSSGDYRGKASVEVVTVLESTSECRITRQTPTKPIVEGDTVVNVAYERGRRTKFVVRGDFDLDYNGEIDWDGPDKVAGLIREWGGEVVKDVDESVDFVVVGQGQLSPEVATNRPLSTVVQDLVGTRKEERAKYEAVVAAAQAKNIPVLTQTQFLFLTGEAGGVFAQR